MKFPQSFTALACQGSRAGDEGLATDGIEQWAEAIDEVGVARSDYEQAFGFGGLGTSEHGRAQVALGFRCVFVGEFSGKSGADGAVGDVGAAPGKRGENAVFAEDYAFDGGVVREHRKDGFGVAAGIGGRLGRCERRVKRTARLCRAIDCKRASWWPARRRLCAMPAPIFPRPMKARFMSPG